MLAHVFNLARHVVHQLATAQLRSPKWRAVEKRWLRGHPCCIACGGKRLLQVHHVCPFEHDPALELDETNLETLCMGKGCHLLLGHGDNFRFFFAGVRAMAAQVRSGGISLKDAAAIAKLHRQPIRTGA